jgi:hypothetical protein
MESGEGFEHLELFDAIGAGRSTAAPASLLLACGALPFLFVRLTSMRCQPVALTFRGL